jgi:hypothetical protein
MTNGNSLAALLRCNTEPQISLESKSFLAFEKLGIKESAGQGGAFHQTVTE